MPNYFTTVLLGYAPDYESMCHGGEKFFESEFDGWGEFSSCKFNEVYANIDLCELVHPMPKDIQDGDGWYGWAIKNWGTKWGTYRTKCVKLGGDGTPVVIQFESAWGPPTVVLDKIIAHFESIGFEGMTVVGMDPASNTTGIIHLEKLDQTGLHPQSEKRKRLGSTGTYLAALLKRLRGGRCG